MVVLDTDFVIDLMRGAGGARALFESLLRDSAPVGVSAVTVLELHDGIARAGMPDRERERVFRALAEMTVLPVDGAVAADAGELHGQLVLAGKRIDAVDAIIASTARIRREPLVTRNAKHFARVPGLRIAEYAP